MSASGNFVGRDSGFDFKIFKNHLLLLANPDIIVPLYQNDFSEWNDETSDVNVELEFHNNKNFIKTGDSHSLNSSHNDAQTKPENASNTDNIYRDPFSCFFNCLIENEFLLSIEDINKIINNNELRYIFYSNRTNFFNLIKFFCFKIVRLSTFLAQSQPSPKHSFTYSCQTLLKSVRFLTKIIPVFFELCYEDYTSDLIEDMIFWNASTSEIFENNNEPSKNGNIDVLHSGLNKKVIGDDEIMSTFNTEINFKARNNFLKDPSSTLTKDTTSLGISLLISLLKLMFMEGFTLPLSTETGNGNISFQLWNNGILSQSSLKSAKAIKPNPVLDANRLELMILLEILCSNSLYSASKTDNKFLASWCCSMPEYLSVYLINSLLSNFIEENMILLKASGSNDFAYPHEYSIFKIKKAEALQKRESNAEAMITEFSKKNGGYSKDPQEIKSIFDEEPVTVQQSSSLRENFFETSRNILTLYFSFAPESISENTKFQIVNSGDDISNLSNVCKRLFSNLNTLSDFKILLNSIVELLKLPMEKAMEEENKIFSFSAKQGTGFFNYFMKSKHSVVNPGAANDEEEKLYVDRVNINCDKRYSNLTELPPNLLSLLVIFEEMLSCNEYFETHVLEIYSNKLFNIFLFYLKLNYSDKNFVSTVLPILTKLMLKITANPIFSLKSLKNMDYDYYTEKLPKTLKIIDYDLNLEKFCYRDFFVYHIATMIINDIDSNFHPKIYLYDMLSNLMISNLHYLLNISKDSTNVLFVKELEFLSKNPNQLNSGLGHEACRKIVQMLSSMVNGKEYLTSFSIDKKDNYQFLLEKSTNNSNSNVSALSNFSIDSGYKNIKRDYKNIIQACSFSETNVNNVLMYDKEVESRVNINDVSNIPYCFTPANKLLTLSLLLRTISFVVVNYYSDYTALIFLLCKYKNVFAKLNFLMKNIDLDVANELKPFLLTLTSEETKDARLFVNDNFEFPFDIHLHLYPSIVDELLETEDDSLNEFDPLAHNVLKRVGNEALSNVYFEDHFYSKSNTNISFLDPSKFSIIDSKTGRRTVNTSADFFNNKREQNSESGRQQLTVDIGHSVTTNSHNKKAILEKSNLMFLPNLNNNAVYHSSNCKRPLGLNNKKFKKLIVKNSDNFRQPISTDTVHTKEFWFAGKNYYRLLLRVINVILNNINQDILLSKHINMADALEKIKNLKCKVLFGKLADFVPPELKVENFSDQYLKFDFKYNSIEYQFFQTLIWRDIFDNTAIEYKLWSDEISGNSELLNNLSSNHNACLPSQNLESHQTPSSPMLERWISNNSLSLVESNKSNISVLNNSSSILMNDSEPFSLEAAPVNATSFLSFNIQHPESQILNKFILSNGLIQPLFWYSTNVKMFPVIKIERDDFSIADITSNFLNKFKFNKVSAAHKTPEEFAADEIKRAYTPRSSISSISSRK